MEVLHCVIFLSIPPPRNFLQHTYLRLQRPPLPCASHEPNGWFLFGFPMGSCWFSFVELSILAYLILPQRIRYFTADHRRNIAYDAPIPVNFEGAVTHWEKLFW